MAFAVLAFGLGVAHHKSKPILADAGAVSATQQIRGFAAHVPGFAQIGTQTKAALAPVPVNITREAELEEDQDFGDFLSDQGLSEVEANAAHKALAKAYDVRRLRAGQDVTLTFQQTGTQETLMTAVFQPSDTKEVALTRAADGSFSAKVTPIPVTRHRMAATGVIRTTLYEAGDRAGVSHALMASLIRLYSHNLDFQRDVHPGDRFEILYDQSVTAKGKKVGESTIIYASLIVGGKARSLYRVTFNDGTIDYFDETGKTTRRALLRTPVAAARITSGFGMRVHPLLGYSKMHKGTDFGAPMGAPIFAAGAGTINYIGFKNGYGRYVEIRHNGKLETAYAHMSRFNPRLSVGSRVTQGQVIGYVGMSGRATGPHLHFEVHVNGQQVNPMSVKNMPSGRELQGKLLVAFKDGQGKIKHEFDGLINAPGVPAGTPQQVAAK